MNGIMKMKFMLAAVLFAVVHANAQETKVVPETDPSLTTLQLTVDPLPDGDRIRCCRLLRSYGADT